MKFIIVGCLILLIPFLLFFPIVSKLIQFQVWKLTTNLVAKLGSIQNEDSRLNYVVYDDKNNNEIPIVLLHGGLSNKLSWFSQIPMLVKSGRQVILIDTRGHGDSSDSPAHSYDLYADDVVKIIDKLKVEIVDIIGWSDGGITALTLGYKYPKRVNRIIAISANFHLNGLTDYTQKIINQPNTWLRKSLNRIWTKAANSYPKLEMQINKLWSTEPQMTQEILLEIKNPVLLIQGENDNITLDHAKLMEETLPNARLKVIKGAGHSAPINHANEINKLLSQFLKINH